MGGGGGGRFAALKIDDHLLCKAHLVGDGRGPAAHFKALGRQIPIGAGPLACQLHAGALILFHNLAQTKVLRWQHPSQMCRDLRCQQALGAEEVGRGGGGGTGGAG